MDAIERLKQVVARLLRAAGGAGGEGGGWSTPASNGADESANGGAPPVLTCQEALERLYEFLDGELPSQEMELVEAHFHVCSRCYPVLQFESAFLEVLERVRGRETCPSELRSRLMSTLEAEGLKE
ncbi:MAG: zf-HC2 domain-containing protein [Gemmatimonadota bacterium]